jgi:hypothetical protein
MTMMASLAQSAVEYARTNRNPEGLGSSLSAVENSLSELDGLLHEMATRLEPVMGPEFPQKVGVTPTLASPKSPYAGRLDDHFARVAQMKILVSDLLQRLEV